MKSLIPLIAILAAATSLSVYSPSDVGNTQEIYKAAIELQQHGLLDESVGGEEVYVNEDKVFRDRRTGEAAARILSHNQDNDGHHYQFSYETENGIKQQEEGEADERGLRAQGFYSYPGDDGQLYTVSYTADENGFRVHGAHLPTPHPDILRALEQNSKDEAQGIHDDEASPPRVVGDGGGSNLTAEPACRLYIVQNYIFEGNIVNIMRMFNTNI